MDQGGSASVRVLFVFYSCSFCSCSCSVRVLVISDRGRGCPILSFNRIEISQNNTKMFDKKYWPE